MSLLSFPGEQGLSCRSSGCRAPAFQEAKMLNRTSSSWDEGGYPPIAHKWGEKGLVWVRAPKILHGTRTTHIWVVPNALTLPVLRVSSRNKGIVQREQATSESHYKPFSLISRLSPPALCFCSYPASWLSLAFLEQRLHGTILAQNKNAALSGKLGS